MAVALHGQGTAGVNRLTVKHHGTGATLPFLTPLFRACQKQLVTKKIQKRQVILHNSINRISVDD
jgi:hypothetical protein